MKRILTVAALFAAGCAAALAFGVSTASAYSLQDLPGLGYTLTLVADLNHTPACSMYYATGNGAPSTLIGSTNPDCTSPQGLQRNIDALIAAYPPPPPPPPPPTTAPTTTAATTTAPTTTEPAPPPPATTVVAALPAAPVADFTGATINPNVVQFTDATAAGGGAIVSRLWLFGDGAAGSGQSPAHVYAGPGTYQVALVVTDANGLGSVAAHDLTIGSDHSITLGPRQTQIVGSKAAPLTKPAKRGGLKKAKVKKRRRPL